MTLTRPQRIALARVYARGPMTIPTRGQFLRTPEGTEPPCTFRQFRRTVRPMLCGSGCVLLPRQGMWLGIEPDGHTHA
jgi:hypothetical protein